MNGLWETCMYAVYREQGRVQSVCVCVVCDVVKV